MHDEGSISLAQLCAKSKCMWICQTVQPNVLEFNYILSSSAFASIKLLDPTSLY